MFRNPRENAHRDTSLRVPPYVGRPPSPPQPASVPSSEHTVTPRRLVVGKQQSMAESIARTPLARSNSRQSPVSNGKGRPKANSSILSFFKKQDSNSREPAVAETLFIEDRNPAEHSGKPSHTTGLIVGLDNGSNNARDEHEDEARFNESNVSVKKRRTSSSPAQANQDPACTPPPKDFDDERNPANPVEAAPEDSLCMTARSGPFRDDSDSESEHDHAIVSEEDTYKRHAHPDPIDNTQYQSPLVDDVQEGKDTLLENGLEQTGFEGFEGMHDDFDDEYEEGEEYVERKWMEEQERLEAEAETGGDLSVKQEFDEGMILQHSDHADAAGSCPICQASFAGVSDQEASVHVNHCLDGNPTPLPTHNPSKAEVTETQDSKQTVEHPIKQELSKKRFERPTRAPRPGQQNPFELGTSNGMSSAFSKMMSGNAEDTAWATAAATENASRGKPSYTRTCPFYKILPGLFICVDAFRYGAVQGCNAYFLSHFHSDHYIGLTATWRNGPIYCSRPTANLVKQQLRVDPQFVVALEFEKKTEVPGTKGVYVTMIPANHCPGSSLFLFEKQVGSGSNPKLQRILHCGDFRACPSHVEHPLLKPEVQDSITGNTRQQRIDVCYLDTTYLNPKYAFPSQEDVIQACADMCVSLNKEKVDDKDAWEQAKRERAGGSMSKFVRRDSAPDADQDEPGDKPDQPKANARGRLLVVVGTYSIGKERICLGIARALNSKIFAPPNKQRICAALEDKELNSRLTSDPRDAQVHMTPLFEIRAETLDEYLAEFKDRFSRAVAFRPSGWNYRPPGTRFTDSPSVNTVLYSDNWKSHYTMKELVPQRGSTSKISTFGVPYSEHSSFRELSMFCCALRIDKIIPTVNIGSAKSRERMKLWCERWATERKKNGLFKAGSREEGYPAWFPGQGTLELRTTL